MSVKMQTTHTWTERPYEASLFPGIGFGLFLHSLGPTGQGTVSGRQCLWGVGLPKGEKQNADLVLIFHTVSILCKENIDTHVLVSIPT
ncbi:hypothetical protein Godav_013428 [Gossypium davidsonii]|uniref:Uncharacterized protein n=1 Tax=Gossypium davidsonii TaxID=34287 RepID=A0A7J8RGB2_GOSDV|nr:hypothetical protein [Gossypium davidsonii]